MKFGFFGVTEIPPWSSAREVLESYVEQFVLADELGLYSVQIAEHHAGPYLGGAPPVVLSHVAARTSQIRLGTAVAVLPFLNPVAAAEYYATLDLLSGGRLDLGVGRGYQPIEFQTFQLELAEAHDRLSESLDIIRTAWQGERFSYQGRFFDIPEIEVLPRPAQTYPPIGVAAAEGHQPGKEGTFTWGARNNLRICVGGFRSNEQLRADRAAQRQIALDAGHAVEAVDDVVAHSSVVKHVFVAETEEAAVQACRRGIEWFWQLRNNRRMFGAPQEPKPFEYYYDTGELFLGTPDMVRDQIKQLRDESGCEYLWTWMNTGAPGREEVLRSMKLFAEEVLPAFR